MLLVEAIKELQELGFEYQVDCDLEISVAGVASFPPGKPNRLSMWRSLELPEFISKPEHNQVLICRLELKQAFIELGFQTISTSDPRAVYCVMANKFDSESDTLLNQTSAISEKAKIGHGSMVGHGSVLGNISIGKNCKIGCNVVIHSKTVIGDFVEIGDNTTIGGPGFGYVTLPDGRPLRIPHLGGVTIEDHVHIGSNVAIDRGTIDNTIIGEHTKIDNLVHIAHNVIVGKNVSIIAGAELSGSVQIGDGAWISPQASIRQKLHIGENAFVGLGSVVVKNVEAGTTVVGVPAKPIVKHE